MKSSADSAVAGFEGAPPAGWTEDDSFGPPDLSQSPQLACTAWNAWRPNEPASRARFVSACFDTVLSTWSAEIEPIALDKIASMTVSTALRARNDATLAPAATNHAGHVATQSLEGHAARGKTSLGFLPSTRPGNPASVVRACLRLCVGENDDARECATALDESRVFGAYDAPPATSIWLRATLSAVHHPKGTALGALGVACILGFAAVATRKRPRRRTK